MSLERQISQLKKLKTIQPNKEWEKKTKHELLSEISSQNRLMKAHKLTTSEKLDMAFASIMGKLVPSVSKMVAGFLIIMMGSGVSIAAQASVPGQALWPIKRSIEKAELTLTFSAVKETEIHIKHVNERMDEIDKIWAEEKNTQPESKEKKEKSIKQVVTYLQKDITAADTSLKVVKEGKKKSLEIVELAKKVKDTTKEITNNLEEKKKQVENDPDNQEINEVLIQAQVVNKEVSDSAVKVALEVHQELVATTVASVVEEGGVDVENVAVDKVLEILDSYETSTPETTEGNLDTSNIEKSEVDQEVAAVQQLVKEILASEMSDTSVEVESVNKKVGGVAVSDLMAIKSVANQQITEDLEEIDNIEETSDEAVKLLGEAKQLMEDGFLIDAYKKMSQVREDYQKLDVVIDEVIRAVYENKTIDPEVIDQLNQIETELKDDNNTEASEAKEVEASTVKIKAEDLLADPQ